MAGHADLLLVIGGVVTSGLDKCEAGVREAMRARGPGEVRGHVARGVAEVAMLADLQAVQAPLLDLHRVLALGLAPTKHHAILDAAGPGFLDRLPPGLSAAVRGADWPALIPLALAYAAGLRERLEALHPVIMEFADEALTMPAVQAALRDKVRPGRPAGPGPSGPGGGRP